MYFYSIDLFTEYYTDLAAKSIFDFIAVFVHMQMESHTPKLFFTNAKGPIVGRPEGRGEGWTGFNTDNDHGFNYTASLDNLVSETHHSIPGNLTMLCTICVIACTQKVLRSPRSMY